MNPWNAQYNMRALIDQQIVDISKMTITELVKSYGELYIFTINDICEREFFMNKYLDDEQYNYIKNKLVVKQVPFSLLNNEVIKSLLTIVNERDLPTHYVDNRGIKKLFESPNVLAISMLNISNDGIFNFIKQYDGISSLNDIIQMLMINNYIQKDKFGHNNKLVRSQMINGMNESNYWCIPYNCKLNITLKFLSRGFKISINNRLDSEVKKILDKIMVKSEEDHDYLSHIFKKQTYVDASSMIEKEGYKLYRIQQDSLILREDFNNILDSSLNKNELYLLLCNVLLSKEYCHLLLNNGYALDKLMDRKLFNDKCPDDQRSLLDKYAPIFSHLWSYGWLTMYLEESIKATRIKQTDRFVFDLETASKLPYFPMNPEDPLSCPYLPIMVNNEVLLPTENNIGVANYMLCNETHNLVQGVVSPDQFMVRLNCFVSGSNNKNYLEDVNWKSIAISGSVMAACLPRFNPLMLNFYDNNIINYNAYFNEYYKDADIDVMCNGDKYEFIDKVYEFKNKICENIKKYNKTSINDQLLVNVNHVKTVAIMVNREFIMKYILPEAKLSYVEVALHLHDIKIKKLFYPWYIKQKMIDNESQLDTPQYFDNKYHAYYELCSVEDVMIIITKKWSSEKEHYEKDKQKSPIVESIKIPTLSKTDGNGNDNDKNESEDEKEVEVDKELVSLVEEEKENDSLAEEKYIETQIKDIDVSTILDDDCLLNCNENLKYRISSQYLPHNFELFRMKYESFFSTVARFHLPIVRAYYDGNKTYLLPSCISACMTMMNMDYKYFAGAKDPIEIINKYRMRGFGTYLNGKEKIRLVDYSSQIVKWNKLYDNITTRNASSTKKVFGSKGIIDKFFRPSNVLLDKETIYSSNKYTQYRIENKYDINRAYSSLFNGNFTNIDSIQSTIFNKTCINKGGYVISFRKWLINGCYDFPIKKSNN